MAIAFLKRNEIDEQRWNACIENAYFSLPYAFTFYLDVVAPQWVALVLNNYEAVMPLPLRRKMGIYYIFRPLLCPQLGIFSLQQLTDEIKIAFAQAIPKSIRFINYGIHKKSAIDNFGSLTIKDNYELNLNQPYSSILKNYKYDTRRIIKLAKQQSVLFENKIDATTIIQLSRQTNQQMQAWFDQHKSAQFIRLIEVLTKKKYGFTIGINDEQGKPTAVIFYVKMQNRIINLINAGTPIAKKNNWMALLINHIIQQHAEQAYILDFEGSNIPSIARFFRKFGAQKTNYYLWNWNRLPFGLKWLYG